MLIDANNATDREGKSRSSRNALKNGLFAARDFIREGEEKEYARTRRSLMTELSPEGVLEETFATEIMGANWRLRRCRMVESSFAGSAALDPMVDELTEKEQKSVDRARAQSHNILRRSITELRKLQTERAKVHEEDSLATLQSLIDKIDQVDRSSFCKSELQPVAQPSGPSACEIDPEPTPRNALCPCGSGTKYKRCCGKDAPPVLHMAA
jgi:uncharacterized protein YchJ